jgi:ubiquinone/menaquinone biosynthesis C-methylase UbiE
MDRKLREDERGYYLKRRHARDFDRRSAGERSLARQLAVAKKIEQYATSGELLDIGCGTARMLLTLARELPAIRFTGTDVSKEMIALARENVREAGLEERITLTVASAEALDKFPTEGFDVVQCHGAFSGWLEPLKSLDEVKRVLRPGGVLYIRDWNRAAPEDELAGYLEGAAKEQARRVRMAYESSYTFEEFKALLGRSPFEMVEFGAEGLWMEAVLRPRE